MSDLISRQAMIDKMRRHRALFCKNRVEFIALPKDEKARVDEIDNCIADLINAPSTDPEQTSKVYKKQAPDKLYYFYCGNCGEMIDCSSYEDYKSIKSYCPYCGAKLYWGGNNG